MLVCHCHLYVEVCVYNDVCIVMCLLLCFLIIMGDIVPSKILYLCKNNYCYASLLQTILTIYTQCCQCSLVGLCGGTVGCTVGSMECFM